MAATTTTAPSAERELRHGAGRGAGGDRCGRTAVPYEPALGPDPPVLECITDEASGTRSYRTPDGSHYPSVTTILGATSSSKAAMADWQMSVGAAVARHIAGTQAGIGTEVHERLSRYVRGDEPWPGYDGEWDRPIDVRGHYDQLVGYACSRLKKTLASEASLWSESLGVAGSVDLVAVLDDTWGDASGCLAVIDFKCLRRAPPPDKTSTYLAQCAAYAVMWTERTGQKIERVVVAQSIASGGVRLAIDAPGGRNLDEFVRRKVEFDRLGIALPGRDYLPEPRAAVVGGGGGGGVGAGAEGRAARPGSGPMARGGAGGAAGSAGASKPASHRPFAVWLSGLPSSGKSTILRELRARIPHMVGLDSDELRKWFSATDYTRVGRNQHCVRIAYLAAHLYRSGVPVGVATCSPFPENRYAARGIIGADNGAFVECYTKCPAAVCEARDGHGLYAAARAGHLTRFTGVDDPYIPPESPDIVLCTDSEDAADSAGRIVELLCKRGLA